MKKFTDWAASEECFKYMRDFGYGFIIMALIAAFVVVGIF
jgi:hypothetical protein